MGGAFSQIQDQYAAEHLVDVAAGTVRDVARMQTAADTAGKRLLTFTLETEVRFAEPGDVHRLHRRVDRGGPADGRASSTPRAAARIG